MSNPATARRLSRWIAPMVAGALAAAPLPPAEVAASLKRLDHLTDLVVELRDMLPRASLDLDARAAAQGLEATSILAWARDQLRLDAYPGVLRGAQGTLLAGAGNSWDQALCTAALLRRGGYQVLVSRGRLAPDQAATLLEGLTAAPPAVDEGARLDDQGLAALAAAIAAAAGMDPSTRAAREAKALADQEAQRRQVDARAAAEAAALQAALGSDLPTTTRAAWIEEARDYAWVRYRKAAGDPWVDAHPAFLGDPALLAGLEASESWDGAIPEAHLHRVRLTASIEVAEKGRLSRQPIMGAWERPTANLAGTSVSLTLAADGFARVSDINDPQAGFARTSWFFPQMGAGLAPGARAFDLRGFLVSPDAASDPMAQLFSRTGDKVLGALDRLDAGTGGEGPPSRELTAAWIELEIFTPGDPAPRVVRRTLLDRVGPAARAAGRVQAVAPMTRADLVARLYGQHELVVLPGDLTPLVWVDRALHHQGEVLGMMGGAVRALEAEDPPRTLPGALGRLADPGALGLALAAGTPLPDAERLFRSGPGIFWVHRSLAPEGARIRQQFDVVQSPRRALRGAGASWQPAPDVVLRAGVRETVAEASVTLPRGATRGPSALAALEGHAAALTRVARADDPALEGLALAPAVRAALVADLERGYQALVQAGEVPAWWRVHPVTGETTGVTGDGAGAATLEYVDLVSIILNIGFTGYGVSQCETVCCVLTTVAMGVATTSCLLRVGADLAGKAAWAFMVIMDVGVNSAVSAAVPPPCNG